MLSRVWNEEETTGPRKRPGNPPIVPRSSVTDTWTEGNGLLRSLGFGDSHTRKNSANITFDRSYLRRPRPLSLGDLVRNFCRYPPLPSASLDNFFRTPVYWSCHQRDKPCGGDVPRDAKVPFGKSEAFWRRGLPSDQGLLIFQSDLLFCL